MNPEHIELAAKAAHEANRAYCEALGDFSQVPWEHAPDWQRDSAINGVRHIADNPNDGWKYGPVKDHPCFGPYHELPEAQKMKDAIFVAVVRGVLAHYSVEE